MTYCRVGEVKITGKGCLGNEWLFSGGGVRRVVERAWHHGGGDEWVLERWLGQGRCESCGGGGGLCGGEGVEDSDWAGR